MLWTKTNSHPSLTKKDLEGEAEAEEGEALGKTGVKIPIKKTDDLKEATKMTIPD